METQAIALARNLTKYYSDFWGRKKTLALDGLDLEIKQSGVFGLLGPNGSGKTTLVKLMLGLIFPTSGEISIFGQNPSSPNARSRIGYLPEESSLHKFMSAEETLRFHGQLHGMSRRLIKSRADELLEKLDLHEARKRRVSEYSKGMARRLGLACALVHTPEFLILDEPTSGLDPLGSRKVREMLLHLKKDGTTILMCSHLLSEIESSCDTIAILDHGRLVKSGTVSELLTRMDMLSIVLRDVSSENFEKYRRILESAGAAIETVTHPSMTLEELFMQLIAKGEEKA